jgi:hypothetical protein
MKDQSPDIIDDTARFWSQRAGKVISREEARQAVENVHGFFQVLLEWERAEQIAAQSCAKIERTAKDEEGFHKTRTCTK